MELPPEDEAGSAEDDEASSTIDKAHQKPRNFMDTAKDDAPDP